MQPSITIDEATALIRDSLAKDYLVNPQVTITVLEYAKRRFTVLGQVQKPGTYEIPGEESVDLLQAIAMAGGYTRLANTSRINVNRTVGGKKVSYTFDARTLATERPFDVIAEDTITIAERLL